LRQGQTLQDAHWNVVGLKLLDHAPHFGERVKRLMGVVQRKLVELMEECIERRRTGFGDTGVQILRDQGHQAVVLREQQKVLPIHGAFRERADELAVFVALRPACAEQQQVEFSGTA
jgi:hypothetical protein